MSDNLACARVREAGGRWLHRKLGPCTEAVLGAVAWDRDGLVDIFAAGVEHAEAEWCFERATGQRQLDECTALMAEASALFMGYADHHKARAAESAAPDEQRASLKKAQVNLAMALALREWLAGVDQTVPLDEVVQLLRDTRAKAMPGGEHQGERRDNVVGLHAERFANREGYGNVRPVTTGPLADPAVVEGIANAIEPGEAATSLSSIKALAFQLHTSDPRFDPAQPVLVNGHPFTPATES
jgi:hypothetical protein